MALKGFQFGMKRSSFEKHYVVFIEYSRLMVSASVCFLLFMGIFFTSKEMHVKAI